MVSFKGPKKLGSFQFFFALLLPPITSFGGKKSFGFGQTSRVMLPGDLQVLHDDHTAEPPLLAAAPKNRSRVVSFLSVPRVLELPLDRASSSAPQPVACNTTFRRTPPIDPDNTFVWMKLEDTHFQAHAACEFAAG